MSDVISSDVILETWDGAATPVHDHLAWGLVGIYRGQQDETVYRRLDDGRDPGRATLEIANPATIQASSALAGACMFQSNTECAAAPAIAAQAPASISRFSGTRSRQNRDSRQPSDQTPMPRMVNPNSPASAANCA